jgi:hypothetical protein
MKLAPGVALGIDWSGAQAARRKIWAARLVVNEDAARVEWVRRPFAALTSGRGMATAQIADGFVPWLERQSFDVAGLDFCFGLAEESMARLQLPQDGPAAIGTSLRAMFAANPDAFKRAAAPEMRRRTDVARRSPFCPTNLRMYRQTFWGLCALAPLARPVPPWRFGEGAVVEILPADVARKLDVGDKLSDQGRRRALGALEAAGIKISMSDSNAVIADREGDALDAIFAAVAASCARADGFAGAPSRAAASGEGWIYSV